MAFTAAKSSETSSHFELHDILPASGGESEEPYAGRRSSSWSTLFRNHLYLWTAFAISLNWFVTSGISFLWQNTVEFVWDFGPEWCYGFFMFSTGLGGLLGVVIGPKIFDGYLGGFAEPSGKELCLLWCMRLILVAALCGTACTALLAWKCTYMVYLNGVSILYWQFVVFILCVFTIFCCINSITGTLYSINTEAVKPELRGVAAGLTVSFQNVFGFACGTLVPEAFAELVKGSVTSWWPDVEWDTKALRGATFAAGMGVAFVFTWVLFFFTRLAARKAHVMALTHRADLAQ